MANVQKNHYEFLGINRALLGKEAEKDNEFIQQKIQAKQDELTKQESLVKAMPEATAEEQTRKNQAQTKLTEELAQLKEAQFVLTDEKMRQQYGKEVTSKNSLKTAYDDIFKVKEDDVEGDALAIAGLLAAAIKKLLELIIDLIKIIIVGITKNVNGGKEINDPERKNLYEGVLKDLSDKKFSQAQDKIAAYQASHPQESAKVQPLSDLIGNVAKGEFFAGRRNLRDFCAANRDAQQAIQTVDAQQSVEPSPAQQRGGIMTNPVNSFVVSNPDSVGHLPTPKPAAVQPLEDDPTIAPK